MSNVLFVSHWMSRALVASDWINPTLCLETVRQKAIGKRAALEDGKVCSVRLYNSHPRTHGNQCVRKTTRQKTESITIRLSLSEEQDRLVQVVGWMMISPLDGVVAVEHAGVHVVVHRYRGRLLCRSCINTIFIDPRRKQQKASSLLHRHGYRGGRSHQ